MRMSSLPILAVDVAGAVLMIIFSFASIRHALRLRKTDPENLVWTYLLWVSIFLGGFAISRSAGHIVKQALFLENMPKAWEALRPISGTMNTFMLIIVASITLFFERVWKIYQAVQSDRRALAVAHQELLALNEGLEARIRERTADLALSEKKIAQADKLASIGQLSSGIAHEINNPLGVILGYTQLLMRSESPGTQKHEDLRTIEKHVKNCKAIVEDLLSFARSSTPNMALSDINETADQALAFIRGKSDDDEITIIRQYGKNLPKVLIDEKKIRQVLINLVINARQAISGNGTIIVETVKDKSGGNVIINVTDTGCGISEENRARIFDPFFTTKPTGLGTGLGLAVSYGIIKSHEGEILVESRPQAGSTFTVVLPVRSGQEEPRP